MTLRTPHHARPAGSHVLERSAVPGGHARPLECRRAEPPNSYAGPPTEKRAESFEPPVARPIRNS